MATRRQRVEALEAKAKTMALPQDAQAAPKFDIEEFEKRLERERRLRREGREAEIPPPPPIDPGHRFARTIEYLDKIISEENRRGASAGFHGRQR